MGMNEINKKKDKVTKVSSRKLEETIIKGMDQVAEDDTPFLQQTGKEELRVLGDANKVAAPDLEKKYRVTFVLPKDEFSKDDYDEKAIIDENDFSFTVKTDATQEPVTPYNRTYLSASAVDLLVNFFEEDPETKEFDMKSGDDLKRASILFFRNDTIIESTKFFIGKLLGLPENLIPYMGDLSLIENGFDLIIQNPSLMNEAYFTVK